METKSKNISLKVILIAIGLGIWVMVIQNAGIIPTKQNVYVKSGCIDADVNGTVDVSCRVNVDNTVDVNIDKVPGSSAGFRTSYTIDGREYNALDVSIR
jgi:hypothetical protein